MLTHSTDSFYRNVSFQTGSGSAETQGVTDGFVTLSFARNSFIQWLLSLRTY